MKAGDGRRNSVECVGRGEGYKEQPEKEESTEPMLWEIHFFFQAEDGIRDVERSRGLGDVYKRQPLWF